MQSGVKSMNVLRQLATQQRGSLCRFSSTAASSVQQKSKADTLFTEEHRQLQKTLKQIIDKEINPYVDEWEKQGQFPAHEVFKKLGDAGFLGVNKPVEYGGLGLDYSYSAAIAEELGEIHCGALPMAIGVQTDMSTPALARFGSDELRKQFLVPAISGDAVSSIAVSEVTGGSDVASIKTKAEKVGDDYVINGSKMWITSGHQADWICVLANTEGGHPHKNKSLIIVPTDTPGFLRARKIEKLGMWSSDTAELFFDDVRVPQSYRIGEEGMGFMYQMMQFQEERLFAALSVIRSLENIINSTIEYTRDRQAFGAPLLNNQVIHFRLAELKTELECYKALTYSAVSQHIAGEDVTMLASMAKLKGGRLSREIVDSCLQYWGGMGYSADTLISRLYRDFRLLSIGGGADEVMLGIICKYMNTLPSPPKK